MDIPLNHTLACILHVKNRRCVTCIEAFNQARLTVSLSLAFVKCQVPFHLVFCLISHRLYSEGAFYQGLVKV